MANILVVEDRLELWPWMETSVADDGRTVYTASTLEQARQLMSECDFDVVLTDLELENDTLQDGIDVLNAAKEKDPETEVIVVTGRGTWKWGVKAMALGAFDYIQKEAQGVDVSVMLRAKATRALEFRELKRNARQSSAARND